MKNKFHRPFEDLKSLLKEKPQPPPRPCPQAMASKPTPLPARPDEERRLFENAMADVTPIGGIERIDGKNRIRRACRPLEKNEADVIDRLKQLVDHGSGFVVADTPEYMAGSGYNVPPETIRRLYRGDFSIQAHIDLHGFGVQAAREALDIFFKKTVQDGQRAVLVVHGRGLSSPKKPILKTLVYEWLTRGPWRKWVIAFSSARCVDGGAGATYVLLRQRPQTRQHRKRRTLFGATPPSL